MTTCRGNMSLAGKKCRGGGGDAHLVNRASCVAETPRKPTADMMARLALRLFTVVQEAGQPALRGAVLSPGIAIM